MPQPVTIQGELRLPAALLYGQAWTPSNASSTATACSRSQARARRWRMDPEAPGGYVLAFSFVLPEEERDGD